LKISFEEMMARIAKLPPEEQDDALECAYALYAAPSEENGERYVTIGEGTEHGMKVLHSQLPTIKEWMEPGRAGWRARVPPHVVEALEATASARMREVEETMALFEDNDS
jgi:hypothetical protein